MTTEQELKSIILAQENRIQGLLTRIEGAHAAINGLVIPDDALGIDEQLAKIERALSPLPDKDAI